ncbi:MAG: ABC transporter permease subunit, partial [Deltaproteobacteria bacterium]|nr:ABC transporter permease subunit [Deltaproteobacteria bacterium]
MWGHYAEQLFQTLPLFFKGLGMTALVSGLGIVFGTILGSLWGIARASTKKWLSIPIGLWVDLIRGTPFLVQIFIVFFILPELGLELEAFSAAILAMTNMAACFICEIVAGGIMAVPRGQIEA